MAQRHRHPACRIKNRAEQAPPGPPPTVAPIAPLFLEAGFAQNVSLLPGTDSLHLRCFVCQDPCSMAIKDEHIRGQRRKLKRLYNRHAIVRLDISITFVAETAET
jgi:hypothetical protein